MIRSGLIDPRSVARDVPGLFEIVFPGLTPGLVAHLNATSRPLDGKAIDDEDLRDAKLGPALLFEVACVRADRLFDQDEDADDPQSCLAEAWRRQSRFYDAKRAEWIGDQDWWIACTVGNSLHEALSDVARFYGQSIVVRPLVPGCQWIATSCGDYSIGERLVEVKCIAGNFSGADYRQVLIYWMLSLLADVEGRGKVWKEATLINPRRQLMVDLDLPNFLTIVGRGATHIEMMQRFMSVIGERMPR